jgi:hypothetical protein
MICINYIPSVDIIYGKPSRSIYDWTLMPIISSPYFLDIEHRLKIAKFCEKMTGSLYSNSSDDSDHAGLIAHNELPAVLRRLCTDWEELVALSIQFSRELKEIFSSEVSIYISGPKLFY